MDAYAREYAVYPISVVAKLTGQSQRQIRYYESVGLVEPLRSTGNQRLYSPDDVDTLLAIKALLDKGLNLQGIKFILGSHPSLNGLESKIWLPQLDHGTILNSLRRGQPLEETEHSTNQLTLYQLLQRRHERQQ